MDGRTEAARICVCYLTVLVLVVVLGADPPPETETVAVTELGALEVTFTIIRMGE